MITREEWKDNVKKVNGLADKYFQCAGVVEGQEFYMRLVNILLDADNGLADTKSVRYDHGQCAQVWGVINDYTDSTKDSVPHVKWCNEIDIADILKKCLKRYKAKHADDAEISFFQYFCNSLPYRSKPEDVARDIEMGRYAVDNFDDADGHVGSTRKESGRIFKAIEKFCRSKEIDKELEYRFLTNIANGHDEMLLRELGECIDREKLPTIREWIERYIHECSVKEISLDDLGDLENPAKIEPPTRLHAESVAMLEKIINDNNPKNNKRKRVKLFMTKTAVVELLYDSRLFPDGIDGFKHFFLDNYGETNEMLQHHEPEDEYRALIKAMEQIVRNDEEKRKKYSSVMAENDLLADWCLSPALFSPPVACEMFAKGEIAGNAELARIGKKYSMDIGEHALQNKEIERYFLSLARNILHFKREPTA